MYLRINQDVGQGDNPAEGTSPLGLGKCPSTTDDCKWPLLPIPKELQSPSNEPGQILLDGIAQKVKLFHGQVDDEVDWHFYIDLSKNVSQILAGQLREIGCKLKPAE